MTSSVLTNASLRIYGENLDPDSVTAILGVSPTSARKRGQTDISPDGAKRRVREHGWWFLHIEGADSAQIGAQLQAISQTAVGHASIPDAELAYLDLYVGGSTGASGLTEIAFEISAEALDAMARTKLPLKVTVTSGPD